MKHTKFSLSLGLSLASCLALVPIAEAAPTSSISATEQDARAEQDTWAEQDTRAGQGAPAVVTADDREIIEKNSRPTVEEKTDQLIVKFKDSVDEDEKAEVLEELSQQSELSQEAEILKETVDDASVVSTGTFLDSQAQQQALTQLEANPAVEYAEPDYIISGAMAANPGNPPNDPYYSGYQWNLRAIDTAGAWNYATGQGVLIGIADTGQTYHPDLDGKYKQGYDFISATDYSRDGDGRDWNPNDEGDWGPNYSATSTWHGTHVAGIAAAKTGNGTGVAGVAPDAQLQAARIMGKDGTAYISDQAAGIAWSAGVPVSGVPNNPTPVDVVNYSEGIIVPDGRCPQVLQSAIDAAHARNVPVVVSAGNNGMDASWVTPANCSGAIVVGSSNIYNTMVGYSNYGSKLDVLAPGGDSSAPIWSSKNSGTYGQGAPNYGTLHGTSMAAPHVAGIVAMMKELDPGIRVEEIRAILRNSGTNVAGYPLVNARRAVEATLARSGYKLTGAIGNYYRSRGASAVFGLPTSNELVLGKGGVAQNFSKNYTIYWSSRTGAHAVKLSGSIGASYRAGGYEHSYGYPSSDELAVQDGAAGGGALQKFALADGRTYAFYWSAASDRTYRVWEAGAIGAKFTREGGLQTYGFPSENETAYSYGYRQVFEMGNRRSGLFWAENTGAHRLNMRGSIYYTWLRSGGAEKLGFPAGDEEAIGSGSAQYFRSATGAETGFFWSPAGGTHTMNSKGALYWFWRNQGFISALGYPRTDETVQPDGSVTVDFTSGARLRWSPQEGVQRVS